MPVRKLQSMLVAATLQADDITRSILLLDMYTESEIDAHDE
jgi:hypothetical protein